MGKVTLRKDEVKEIGEKLSVFGFNISKNDKIEVIDGLVVSVNNVKSFFYMHGRIVPSLKLALEGKVALKKIAVDMGAVKFVVGGADIMRPGIVEVDESIQKNEVVAIVDVNNHKPLAIGEALFSGVEMKQMATGKAVKNLHFVGDKLWNL